MHKAIFVKMALMLCLLTACGEGSAFDESIKASYREKLISACTSTAQGSVPKGVTIDLDKICGCTADKIMEGKSAKDLATKMPGSAEDLAKAQSCITELYPNGLTIKADGK